jgi:hypothetical protein
MADCKESRIKLVNAIGLDRTRQPGLGRAATTNQLNWSLAKRLYHLAEWWHLLSLDAPTVAALWAWFFARAMHLHLVLLPALLLGLGTWLLYVADRILDGLHQPPNEPLRERHHFHARHRTAFLRAASLLLLLLAWYVVTRMRPEARREDIWIALCALLYFYAVHRTTQSKPRLPKELAVALVFAAATAVPAWSQLGARSGLGKEQLAPAVLFFAALCWINCVGIQKWEAGGAAHATTRWASLHLRAIVTMVALFAVAAAVFAPSPGLTSVYLAACFSSGLLLLLDARSTRLSPLHLRIAADAALLTPLALFHFAR